MESPTLTTVGSSKSLFDDAYDERHLHDPIEAISRNAEMVIVVKNFQKLMNQLQIHHDLLGPIVCLRQEPTETYGDKKLLELCKEWYSSFIDGCGSAKNNKEKEKYSEVVKYLKKEYKANTHHFFLESIQKSYHDRSKKQLKEVTPGACSTEIEFRITAIHKIFKKIIGESNSKNTLALRRSSSKEDHRGRAMGGSSPQPEESPLLVRTRSRSAEDMRRLRATYKKTQKSHKEEEKENVSTRSLSALPLECTPPRKRKKQTKKPKRL